MLTGFIGKTAQRALENPQINSLVRASSKNADGLISKYAEPGAEAVLNIGARIASKVLPDRYTPLSADVVEVCNSLIQSAQQRSNNQSFFTPVEEKILDVCKLASVVKPNLAREVVADIAKRNLTQIKENGMERFYNSVLTLAQAQPKQQIGNFISSLIMKGVDAVTTVLPVKLPRTEMAGVCSSIRKTAEMLENKFLGFSDFDKKILEVGEIASIARPDTTHEIISTMIESKLALATQELENPITRNDAIKKLEFYKPLSDKLTILKDKIVTPPSITNEVKDLEAKLFAIGLDSNCSDQYTFARHLHTAAKRIKEKGIAMPVKEISLSNLVESDKRNFDNLMESRRINDVLLLSRNADWAKMAEMTEYLAEKGILSTNLKEHSIYAHIGQQFHKSTRTLTLDELKMVGDSVSKASGKDRTGKLFVGEYFASLMDSKIHPDDEVKRLYVELGGVLPVSPFAKVIN